MRPPKLVWNAIGFKKNTKLIVNVLDEILDKIPEEHKAIRRTPENFRMEFTNIIDTMDRIDAELQPSLEKQLRVKFQTRELLYLALAQTSLSSLYRNFGEYMKNVDIDNPIRDSDIVLLSSSGETSKVLALLGDSALDLAVVETHWETSVDKVGDLTRKRSEFVKNENLAKICDKFELYEYRLRKLKAQEKSKETEVNHLKGTLVEAIIGIIYMENNQEELIRLIPYLQ